MNGFHQNTGPVSWQWPVVVDPMTPENQQKLKDVAAWMKRHGIPGSYGLVFYRMEKPPISVPDPPNWPFVAFGRDWTGPQPAKQFDRETDAEWVKLSDDPRVRVLDFELAILRSPGVAITELQNRFQVGNPMVLVPYPDPPDPQAPPPPPPVVGVTNALGKQIEGVSGKYYCLDSSVTEISDGRGHFLLRTRATPFGSQFWYEKV